MSLPGVLTQILFARHGRQRLEERSQPLLKLCAAEQRNSAREHRCNAWASNAPFRATISVVCSEK